eukprot:1913055-Pleurochrysis_carterae.AAC.1
MRLLASPKSCPATLFTRPAPQEASLVASTRRHSLTVAPFCCRECACHCARRCSRSLSRATGGSAPSAATTRRRRRGLET